MTNTEKSSPESNSLVELHFPEKLTGFVWLGIAMGSILVATSVLSNRFGLDLDARSSILVSSGIAIILASFGGQATVRGKGYVFAGVAGIAVGMLVFLEYYRGLDWQRDFDLQKEKSKHYVRGLVDNIPSDSDYSAALLMGTVKLKSIYLDNPDKFAFAVFKDQIAPVAYASFRLEANSNSREDISIALATSCFEAAMGSERPLDWALRSVDGSWEVVDRRDGDRVVARLGGDRVEPCAPPPREVRNRFGFGIVANAQEISVPGTAFFPDAMDATAETDLTGIAAALVSDDVAVRREARHNLSGVAPGQIADVVSLIGDDPSNFQLKFGVAIALAEKFREESSVGLQMAADDLSIEEKNVLVGLAADPDPTIRAYGGEVVAYIADKDIVSLAAARATSAEDEQEKEIWASITKSGYESLNSIDKESLSTNSEIHEVIVN